VEPDPATRPWASHPDLVDQPEWSSGLKAASWIWAFVPLVSLGIANAAVFLYAAIRKRTWAWWITAVGYIALCAAMFSLTDSPDGSTEDAWFSAFVLTNWIVGTGHALGVRRRVFQPAGVTDLGNDPVLAAAVHAQERRDLARRILAQDPRLASDLGIGRPDLKRGYDDGGLVDANSAPVAVLATLPGLTRPLAERIVAAREATSGFTSLDEMAILADVPPDVVDTMRDRLVLSPR
jgi:DNA uptake protein ComE-like DNA-binding protein